MKTCSKCDISKSKTDFYKMKNGKDGLAARCKSCDSIRMKKYNSKESTKVRRKEYVSNNMDRILQQQKQRRQEDLVYRLKQNIRARLRFSFKAKSWHKTNGSADLLGCTYEQAIVYIENQFKDGMSWDNYGEWHIDHIIPLDSATTKEELEQLCNYRNLQPLWALENKVKSNKIN